MAEETKSINMQGKAMLEHWLIMMLSDWLGILDI